MKKFLFLVLTSLMVVGCGQSPTQTPNTNPSSTGMSELFEQEISGSITVSCYDTAIYKDFLDEAVTAFNQLHPQVTVSIETFSQMPETRTRQENGRTMTLMTRVDDTKARDDYISKINTELMSKKGADILAADVIPYTKYVKNGQLENLLDYMSADDDFNSDDYRKNVLDAAQYQKRLYMLPISYSFNYAAYDSTLMEGSNLTGDKYTTRQLFDAAKESYNGENKLIGLSPIALFQKLLDESYTQFIDVENKKVNIDSAEFAELLELVTQYIDDGFINAEAARGQVNMGDLERQRSEKFYFKSIAQEMLMQIIYPTEKRVMFSQGTGDTKDDQIAGVFVDAQGNLPFSYSQGYLLNSNSQNKRAAWEFLKFLLSPTIQQSMNLRGLPLHNQARSDRAEKEITGELFDPQTDATQMTVEQQQIHKDYMSIVDKYSDMINTYLIKDATISSILDSELRPFFEGSKNAEDVIRVLQSKIEMYVNE